MPFIVFFLRRSEEKIVEGEKEGREKEGQARGFTFLSIS
jgi:hypothetical protein